MKIVDLGLNVPAGRLHAVREHLAQAIHRLALPRADLIGMDLIAHRDLLDRAVAT